MLKCVRFSGYLDKSEVALLVFSNRGDSRMRKREGLCYNLLLLLLLLLRSFIFLFCFLEIESLSLKSQT